MSEAEHEKGTDEKVTRLLMHFLASVAIASVVGNLAVFAWGLTR